MAEETGIEWCDSTQNFWLGCTKVSPGCDHCYAEVSTPSRTQHVMWGPGQPRHRTGTANWAKPLAWERAHLSFELEHGRRRRVFAQSLSDTFDNEVPEAWRAEVFEVIRATPHLDWLLLTKRIGNVAKMMPAEGLPPNVWLGISVVNQEEADRDIPKLLDVPARVRFLSMEPLLGPVDLSELQAPDGSGNSWDALSPCGPAGIDWVIVGGESGTKARPMHPEWVRALRDQCASAGVPFLFKQWGEWTPGENVERVRGTVDTTFLTDDRWDVFPLNLGTDHGHIDDQPDLYRVGKKAAGRLLDGVTHDGYPEVHS